MGDEPIMAKAREVLGLDTINLLSAKVDALTKLVSKSQINSIDNAIVACVLCGGSLSYNQCNMNSNASEDVNFIQGAFNQRGGLNSNTYNPEWRNLLGFSWSNTSSQLNPPFNQNFSKPQNPPSFPVKPSNPFFNPQPPLKANFEGLMEEFLNQ